MPPKKKGKKTKAEIEAEKIAEAAAAEQKKINDQKAAEEAIRLAEEAAKKLEEERKTFRQDELGRLAKSLETLSDAIALRKSAQESKMKEEMERREWDAYLDCSSKPKINDGELNTYITETLENELNTMKDACECFVNTESIIEDISKQVIRMKGEQELNKRTIDSIEKFVPSLRNVCLKKLDVVTANILQHSDNYFAGAEDKEIRIAEKADGLNCLYEIEDKKYTF